MDKPRHIRFKELVPHRHEQQVAFRKKFWRAVIHVFAWTGMAILYYIAFSFFFDTPVEYRMKSSTRLLRNEYKKLDKRYDTIQRILDNVVERDRHIFRTLFESDPYSFDNDYGEKELAAHEVLLSKTNRELGDLFFRKLNTLEKKASDQLYLIAEMEQHADSLKDGLNYIPAIQPVINKDLTLLTASYGMRIHPFYKTLTAHQGVDYTVSDGSRVFATADGRVSRVITQRTSSGNTVIINHGNGYETSYSHLGKIYVKQGQSVRRGDIIAQSGNSGLSLAPHLHYEIIHNGMRIDPVHYFFMELDYKDYRKIIRIAQSGMQSFD